MDGKSHLPSSDAIFAGALGIAVLFGVALGAGEKPSPRRGFLPTTMCHYAGPNHLITVSVDDVALFSARLAQGDTLGPCPDERAPAP